MDNDPIIDKVKKMLDLADNDGATEGERENALRMAWAYIKKHNLDIDEIKARTNEEPREDLAERFYGRPWTRSLGVHLSKLFFCKYYWSSYGDKNLVIHHFVGKQSNAITCKLMAMYLVSSIRKESGRVARANGSGASGRRSFCLGAVGSIASRVAEMLEQEASTPGTGTSLAVLDVSQAEAEANDFFLEGQGTKLVTSANRSKGVNDWKAYNHGLEYGSTLNLNPMVDGVDPKALK